MIVYAYIVLHIWSYIYFICLCMIEYVYIYTHIMAHRYDYICAFYICLHTCTCACVCVYYTFLVFKALSSSLPHYSWTWLLPWLINQWSKNVTLIPSISSGSPDDSPWTLGLIWLRSTWWGIRYIMYVLYIYIYNIRNTLCMLYIYYVCYIYILCMLIN